MRKLIITFGTLSILLIAAFLWLSYPIPSSATPTAKIDQATATPAAKTDALTNNPQPAIQNPNSEAITCDPLWSQVANSSPANLYAVASVSYYDAWAVGDGSILRWNGTSWSPTAFPTPTGIHLRAVSSRQANDIWAGGYSSDGSSSEPVAYHWDGTAWTSIPIPIEAERASSNKADGLVNTIYGIAPTTAGGAVAVGATSDLPTIYNCNSLGNCTLATQSISTTGSLLAVDALGANNVWAVGVIDISSLILHYDGTSWQQSPSPNIGNLRGVAIVAPNDIWAVGLGGALHYNGTTWTQVDAFPNMAAVSALATNDIWAAGYSVTGSNIWHWNGTAWTGSSPTDDTPLLGISARTPNDVWAVGEGGAILRYAAPQQLEDVPPGSTFYSFVQDLTCKAVVSGYPCGGTGEPCNPPNNLPYFRPTANVTRGQLAKIIVLAANIPTPAADQTFEDVPIGSTFHLYVEALAFQGAIGGYPCGGPGEPCGSDNKPYFRPNVTSTRGQTSKIVAVTAGFTDPFITQTFEDVPTDSTFYLWIENLAGRAIINGYPCGGPGEPCGSGNKPYFRPAANVTRGQMSKIAVITFNP